MNHRVKAHLLALATVAACLLMAASGFAASKVASRVEPRTQAPMASVEQAAGFYSPLASAYVWGWTAQGAAGANGDQVSASGAGHVDQ